MKKIIVHYSPGEMPVTACGLKFKPSDPWPLAVSIFPKNVSCKRCLRDRDLAHHLKEKARIHKLWLKWLKA